MKFREKRILIPLVDSLRLTRNLGSHEEDKDKKELWNRLAFLIEIQILKVARGDYENLEKYQAEVEELVEKLK